MTSEHLTDIDAEFLAACKHGSLSGVQAALSLGASPDAIGDYDKSAVHLAVESHSMPLLHYLVNELNLDIHQKDDRGRTPAHYAAITNDGAMIGFLAGHRANFDAPDTTGLSARKLAEAYANTEAMSALRELEGSRRAKPVIGQHTQRAVATDTPGLHR